jgi:predicted RecA/RadA family phage recombinase
MKNAVQPGNVITIPAPANVTSGQPGLVGVLFGVYAETVASGLPVAFQIEGVVEIAKDNNLVISAGDRVFWVPGSSWVNKTLTAQQCVGVAVAAATQTSTTVKVKLGAYVPVAT